MQRATATDHFATLSGPAQPAEPHGRGPSLNSMDSFRPARREAQLRDMLQLLEIKTHSKKLLHAPSLQVFVLRRFAQSAALSKKRMYMLLRAWRRAVRGEGGFALDFENVYFDDRSDVAYLNFNHTGLYPLKVG